MKHIFTLPIFVVTVVAACVGCRTSTQSPAHVSIEPYPHNPPDQNQYLAFKAKASWLDGYLRVRFPENVNSTLGMHFLDNLEPSRPRVSDVHLPDWKTDPATGDLSY